ncbi:hypothetical protein NMY22_g4159 [Coprinellus aureogranulatus]|nr:hypothetical protein NMY22_g4159 [Coprinellus aureogranulatus]
MSLLRPDCWNPSPLDFALGLLNHQDVLDQQSQTSAKPMDYVCATLIGVFFFGLQGCLLLALVQNSRKSLEATDNLGAKQGVLRQKKRLSFYFYLTVALATVFMVAMILQSVNFGVRVWSLGMVKPVSTATTTLCRGTICLETTKRFDRVMLQLALAFSFIMQFLIVTADLLLVIRCVVVFADKRWVSFLPGFPFLLSFASVFIGIETVFKDFPIDANTIVDMSPHGYISSILSTTSSVAVNIVVTTAIVIRILWTRREVLKLRSQITKDLEALTHPSSCTSPAFPCDGRINFESPFALRPTSSHRRPEKECDHFVTVSAILVESALPSAILGIFACLVHPLTPYPKALEQLMAARFSICMLWAAFTVMAPQMIMLRVLLKGDAHTRWKIAEESQQSISLFNNPLALPRQTRQTLTSRDSLSLSPSLASLEDIDDAPTRRCSQEDSGIWLEERSVAKMEPAKLKT